MKKILIFALAMVILLSCVACSGENATDPTSDPNSTVNNGAKPEYDDTPIELRPPANNHGKDIEADKKPFDQNDPRKQYLENKYGVNAYLVAEKTPASLYSLFALEGYEGAFRLFAKTDLIANGAPEDYFTTDYVDDAWFAILYAEIYAYFAQAAKDVGVDVDRIIVESQCVQSLMYDHNKPFAESLASAHNGAKRFNLIVYGDFSLGDDAIDKLIAAFDKLDFTGRVEFRTALQDISNVTNDNLCSDTASVYSKYCYSQQIK